MLSADSAPETAESTELLV